MSLPLIPVTLRAWQRRYGLLKPQRTDGGHRL
ncbi:MerR family DNA-binding transcriptional regulator, partial [Escherichia coli]